MAATLPSYLERIPNPNASPNALVADRNFKRLDGLIFPSGASNVIVKNPATSAQNVITPTADATALTLQAFAAQVSPVFAIQDATAANVFTVSPAGAVVAASLTLGTALPAASGGTGHASYTTGDLLYASGAAALSKLSIGSTGHFLKVAGGVPAWSALTSGEVTTALGFTPVTNARTISTTGPLTGGGALSANLTLSISTNGISNTLFRQSVALSVVGRSANSTGDVADIAAGTDAHVLRRSGTTLGFGTIGDASITALAWSKITGTPTTLAGYGIVDGAGSTGANPAATIGLTAVNGVATTFLRSDGAPALSQAIVPTWSGVHTFTLAPVFSSVTASQFLMSDGSKALTSVSASAARTALGLAAIATSGSASDLSAGTLPGARFPALTGAVTTSAGSLATTLATDIVGDTNLRNSGAYSVIGRASGTSGDPADIGPASDGQVLTRSGSSLVWGQLSSGGIQDNAVGLGKLVTIAAGTFLGNNTGGASVPIALTVSQTRTALGLGTADSPTFTSGTFTGTLGVTGAFTGSGDWIYTQTNHNIRADTSDGSDNKRLCLGGGGATNTARGATIWLSGNEYSGAGGTLYIQAGNVSGSGISLETAAISRLSIDFSGNVLVNALAGTGTRLATSTSTGVLGNATTIAGSYTFSSTVTANITGNASTATTLQTTRTINGVNFNGSGNITVPAAAGTLTGSTLAAGVTASSLTSLGTLTGLTMGATAFIYCTSTNKTQILLNAGSANYGTIQNDSGTRWSLGYTPTANNTVGTAALSWESDKKVIAHGAMEIANTLLVGTGTVNPASETKDITIGAGSSGTAVASLTLRGFRTTDAAFGHVYGYHGSNMVGRMSYWRDGADNSGKIVLGTVAAGAMTNWTTLDKTGLLSHLGTLEAARLVIPFSITAAPPSMPSSPTNGLMWAHRRTDTGSNTLFVYLDGAWRYTSLVT